SLPSFTSVSVMVYETDAAPVATHSAVMSAGHTMLGGWSVTVTVNEPDVLSPASFTAVQSIWVAPTGNNRQPALATAAPLASNQHVNEAKAQLSLALTE